MEEIGILSFQNLREKNVGVLHLVTKLQMCWSRIKEVLLLVCASISKYLIDQGKHW